jgi:hypothetical protein
MPIPFSIDPDALECDLTDLSLSITTHRRVIQEWRRHGVLVHSHGPLKDSAIFKKIEALPQEFRKMWKSALVSTRRKQSTKIWDGLFPGTELQDLLPVSNEFRLALFDTTRAVIVGGVDSAECSRIVPELGNMEICKLHSVNESFYFAEAARTANRVLNVGDNCATEWRDRYSSHITQADHIAVVDRYILANHNWRLRKNEISGLHRLLDNCFSRSKEKKVNVKLLCAVQNNNSTLSSDEILEINLFCNDIASRYSGGGIRQISFFVLPDKDFSKIAHERYVRSDYTIFGMDSGLDVFGGLLAKKSSVVWRHDTAESLHFNQQEAALQLNVLVNRQLI